MKHMYNMAMLCLIGTLLSTKIFAQDPEFTQFYANPLYLNPALAGNKICTRVGVNYRAQWPNIHGTYNTTGFYIDKLVHQVKGGIGLVAMHDRAGKGTLNTTGVGLIYAPHIKITRDITWTTALQVGYWQKSLNAENLNFGDEIDPRRGYIFNTQEQLQSQAVGNFDLSAGTVLTMKHFFVGGAVHHILEPNESFLEGNSPLPRKYTVHAGGIIRTSKSHDGDSYISPNIMYRQQGDFQQFNLGVYLKRESIVGGLWYRGNDAFIVLLGLEKERMRIGYSYDVTVSRLTNASAGAHEISLGYQFSCKMPSKKYRPGICPSW